MKLGDTSYGSLLHHLVAVTAEGLALSHVVIIRGFPFAVVLLVSRQSSSLATSATS